MYSISQCAFEFQISVHICLCGSRVSIFLPFPVITFLAVKRKTVISLLLCECWVIESQQAQLWDMLGNRKWLIFHKG